MFLPAALRPRANSEPVPFALAVTEALLAIYLDRISGKLQEAVHEANWLIRDSETRQDQAGSLQLEKLRFTKQRLDSVQSQAKSFQTMLFQALEDEDDLSDLAKSVGPTKEEWELCFEYYSQSAAEVDAEVSAHAERIDDLENFWLLRLSSRRLELEKSQLWLEQLGVGLSFGAFVTGIFGMNITSGLETRRPIFFYRACLVILFFSCALSVGLKIFVSRRLRHQGIAVMPNLLHGRAPPERRRFLRAARSF
ncbi:MRS2 [Symbiodinium natans]|uniref:MRS2 protein n=1 Tax=Symbiodinium natans TaxID=878477 RepID=A0A812IDR1_9DINO|nr:MRS2 [Symbiodinium natans]